MVRVLPILIFGALLVPGLDSEKPKAETGRGFIDITVESNLDRQYFTYNLKQRCVPVPGISELSIDEPPLVRLKIPVNDFVCTNKFAYRDFLETLKAKEYPWLEIDIPPYSEVREKNSDTALLQNVNITVAGVTNKYNINCKLLEADNEHQVFEGTAVLKLTDFGIIPPVRFMGLVRVKNEITISFDFCLSNSRKLSVTPVSF